MNEQNNIKEHNQAEKQKQKNGSGKRSQENLQQKFSMNEFNSSRSFVLVAAPWYACCPVCVCALVNL